MSKRSSSAFLARLENLWDAISSWGSPEATDLLPPSEKATTAEIRVLLHRDGRQVHVGSLRQDAGQFVFEYSREFKERDDLPPISAFRELSTTYRSPKLWPFFHVRIPPLTREDVRSVVEARGIDRNDQFALLAAVGAKTIASPYELELVKPDTQRRSQAPAKSHRPAHAH